MKKRSLGLAVAALTVALQTAYASSPEPSRTVRSNESIQSSLNTATHMDSDRSKLPSHYAVSLNYPNPFNLETTIEYTLPKQSGVFVTAYNALGEQIAILKNDIEDAGYHNLVWGGTNSHGVAVASGIYFLRIVADDFYAIRKMMILK